MNHVKVAPSFQNTSSFRRDGEEGRDRAARAGHPLAVQQALHTLEIAATRVMEIFQPHEIANILHIHGQKAMSCCLLLIGKARAK